ncbi:MAG: transcription factor S [Methanomassiliicoccales archaeon]
MKYCPSCRSLMIPDRKSDKFVCKKCNCKADMEKDICKTVKVSEVRQKEMAVIDGNAPTLPKTAVECPKCGHNEAYWVLRQTRAADEPETKIYRCVKCSSSWREY